MQQFIHCDFLSPPGHTATGTINVQRCSGRQPLPEECVIQRPQNAKERKGNGTGPVSCPVLVPGPVS